MTKYPVAAIALLMAIFSIVSCNNHKSITLKGGQGVSVPANTEDVTVPVDYSFSLKDLLTKGHYSYVCHRATDENFHNEKKSGTDTLDGILVHFDGSVTMDSVMKWSEGTVLRPGTIKELAALGLQGKEYKDKRYIFALGSKEYTECAYYTPLFNTEDHSFRTSQWPQGKWDGNNYYFFVYKKDPNSGKELVSK